MIKGESGMSYCYKSRLKELTFIIGCCVFCAFCSVCPFLGKEPTDGPVCPELCQYANPSLFHGLIPFHSIPCVFYFIYHTHLYIYIAFYFSAFAKHLTELISACVANFHTPCYHFSFPLLTTSTTFVQPFLLLRILLTSSFFILHTDTHTYICVEHFHLIVVRQSLLSCNYDNSNKHSNLKFSKFAVLKNFGYPQECILSHQDTLGNFKQQKKNIIFMTII